MACSPESRTPARPRSEGGFVMLVLLGALLPMLLVAGTYTLTMIGRSNQLRVELDQERALLAAEAGIDEAIYRGRIGTLIDGVPFQRQLAGGMAYSVMPTHLKYDSLDNDDDTDVDEDDENVFQIVVTGTYRGARRRVAAYLGPVPLVSIGKHAVGFQNPDPEISLSGSSLISGDDISMAGVPQGTQEYGFTIASPGTTADLSSELTGGEENRVVGLGGSPSLGTTSPLPINDIVAVAENVADIVLTNAQYTAFDFGNGPANDAHITFRNGDVKFAGNSRGAGILVVTGDLTITGTFRFDGIVIVLGDFDQSAGTAKIYGSLIQGPAGSSFESNGNLTIQYSSEAIALANSVSGLYVAYNGWQELSR